MSNSSDERAKQALANIITEMRFSGAPTRTSDGYELAIHHAGAVGGWEVVWRDAKGGIDPVVALGNSSKTVVEQSWNIIRVLRAVNRSKESGRR